MKYVLFLVCILIVGCTDESLPPKTPYLGMSLYAIMSNEVTPTECDVVIDVLDASNHPAVSILWGSFGGSPICFDRIIKSFQDKALPFYVEIHLTREVGRDRGLLSKYDLFPDLNVSELNLAYENMNATTREAIQARVDDILGFIEQHTYSGEWALSMGLESSYSLTARNKLYDVISEVWPYEIVYNPINDDEFSGVRSEFHTYEARAAGDAILNGDGQDLDFLIPGGVTLGQFKPATMQDVKGFIDAGIKGGSVVLLWSAKWQGVNGHTLATHNRSVRMDGEDIPRLKELMFYGSNLIAGH